MKLYRFMSRGEFQRFCSCETIVSPSKRGLLFLPEKVHCFSDSDSVVLPPEKCLSYLHGWVSEDLLVEFETEKAVRTYREHLYPSVLKTLLFEWMVAEEFRLSSYSKKNFRLLRLGKKKNGYEWND